MMDKVNHSNHVCSNVKANLSGLASKWLVAT